MKFHEYEDSYTYNKRVNKAHKIPFDLDVPAFYRQLETQMREYGRAGIDLTLTELCWYEDGRPYYNLYPGICEILKGFNLDDLPFGSFFHGSSVNSLAVHLPEGHEIKDAGTGDTIGSLCLARTTPSDIFDSYGIVMTAQGKESKFTYGMFSKDPNKKCIEVNKYVSSTDFARVALAVLLLDKDPAFFEPHLLNSDAHKQIKNEQHREALIKRAEQARGRLGWVVGAKMESVPHVRRPHLGRRWCGPGRKQLKLVMVKGSIVHREKVTTIPTGKKD